MPFGTEPPDGQTIVTNSSGSLARIGKALVSLDPLFAVAAVCGVIYLGHDFTVANGVLRLKAQHPMAVVDRLQVATFGNEALLGLQTHTFRANPEGVFLM